MPPEHHPEITDETHRLRRRLTITLAFLALAAMYMGTSGVVDTDLWHQMALIREALAQGALPTTDPFAYTPTVEPMVHHEWGMGVVLYAVYTNYGAFGLAILRDVLSLGIAVGCLLCARRRGAGNAVLWATLPLAIFLVWIGITTVRAQMFTLLFLAWLLYFIELDRAGRRWWIAPWLVMYVLWANLHAGFIVGAIAYGAYAFEQLVLRRPVGRLIAVGLAMIALIAVNPYGAEYYSYLWHALRMERPLITEWQSILHAWPPIIALYVFSLVLVAYGLARGGYRHALGLLFLFAAAYAAARHQRHLSIYAVAWACYVPAMLQATPLGAILSNALLPRRRAVTVAAGVAALACAAVYLHNRPWSPILPTQPGDHPTIIYPVGAVDHLRESGFRGNLLTPFTAGAFVTWQLYPDVLVSIDGRYEVAYPPELLDRHVKFFAARDGWERLIEDYPPDAILVRTGAGVTAQLDEHEEWTLWYRDSAYTVYVPSQE